MGRRRVTSKRQQCLAQGATTQQHWKSGQTSLQLHPLGQGRGDCQSFTLVPRMWSLGYTVERQGQPTFQNQRRKVHPEIWRFLSLLTDLWRNVEKAWFRGYSAESSRGARICMRTIAGGEIAKPELEAQQGERGKGKREKKGGSLKPLGL